MNKKQIVTMWLGITIVFFVAFLTIVDSYRPNYDTFFTWAFLIILVCSGLMLTFRGRQSVRLDSRMTPSKTQKEQRRAMNLRKGYRRLVLVISLIPVSIGVILFVIGLLDDNEDGIGSNVLSEGYGDGLIASAIYLGVGLTYDTNSIENPAELLSVTETVYLGSTSSFAKIWAEGNDDSQISTAWVEIRLPSRTLFSLGGTDQLEIDLQKEFLSFNEGTDRWEKTYDLFSESGMYELFYFARDMESQAVSSLRRSVVYKNRVDNNKPYPFGLASPQEGAEQKTALVLDWQDAIDPDGDEMTYNLLIATDIDFNTLVYNTTVQLCLI